MAAITNASSKSAKKKRPSGCRSPAFASVLRIKVATWGAGLGVRLPPQVISRLNLVVGSEVSIEVHKIPIMPKHVDSRRKKWAEAELLEGVTREIVRGEIVWGEPVGNEIW